MNKKYLTLLALALMIILSFTLAACNSTQPSEPAAPAPTADPADPAATPQPSEPEPADQGKPVFLNISTSTSGGTFYIVGGKLADMINKNIANAQATAEVTAGGVENARLIKGGDTDLAFMPGDTLYNAAHGVGEFESDGAIDVQILAALYSNPLQIVALEKSGITSIADLKGKKVSIGAPGSSTAVRAEIVLNAHGLTLDDIKVDTTTSSEAATQLGDGLIDAAFFASGAPMAAIMDVAVKNAIVLLPVTDEAMAQISSEHPYLYAYTIPAEVYPGVPEVVCVANMTSLCAAPGLSEDLAYQITKMLFDNSDDFGTAHKSVAAEFNLQDAVNQAEVANYHPGAIKYYQEVGAMQ